MSQHKKNPVVAGAAAARRQGKPNVGASDDDFVDNPGNQYSEARLVIVMKRDTIIVIQSLKQTQVNTVTIIVAPSISPAFEITPFCFVNITN